MGFSSNDTTFNRTIIELKSFAYLVTEDLIILFQSYNNELKLFSKCNLCLVSSLSIAQF